MPPAILRPAEAQPVCAEKTAFLPESPDFRQLTLGPLDLNLLGLMVHLDQVVLDITAQSGAGNLLGNLLCSVANLLNGGGTLRRSRVRSARSWRRSNTFTPAAGRGQRLDVGGDGGNAKMET